MTDPTVTALREVAGLALYRRNAFHLAGVPTTAGRRDVRQRRQKVDTLLKVGADAGLDGDPHEIAAAFDVILGDPRQRLVHELFGTWHGPGATCHCAPALHQDHDAAVRAHRAAIEAEQEPVVLHSADRDRRDKLWHDAGRMWHRQIRRAVFWDHVAARIAALDDRQLDESVIDTLRRELPVTLVRPLLHLAAQDGPRQAALCRLARDWPGTADVVSVQLEQAAEPLYQEIRTGTNELTEALERDGDPRATARRLRDEILPKLERIAAIIPDSRSTARLRNSAGTLYNNCAVRLIDDIGAAAHTDAPRWLNTAETLVNEPETLERIRQNRSALNMMVLVPRAFPGRRRVPNAHANPDPDHWAKRHPPAAYRPPARGNAYTRLLVWLLISGFLIWALNRCADAGGFGG